ncbi:chromate transporter [Pullulanibacillus pueri]|uniref:Putative transporter YwrA n=1 Tax=Pullulanibacillus pueri TaxID=1437324 RepID=A0A8J2ZX73_9BACL|nr:chromate transporter [Pullulanibacillus pueri]MBM7681753.1 chromate transporter [Pullulanibacillus pueri]GGH84143.1 putative transporter YwrA [Pullulanibacillus pueri]
MANLWHIFLAFFIPGIVGYGGGPASIPLIENEVVQHYHWLTVNEFSRVLALGNSLPGPIATKMAGYIGFEQGNILGLVIGLLATVAPSILLMIVLLKLLDRFKKSPKVKRLTLLIRPTIAVLLAVMTYEFLRSSFVEGGAFQTVFLIIVSFVLLERLKIHPAFVILGSLCYGAIFMAS